MSSITLSAGVRANLLQLQRTADLTQITQERLSTGRDVNSALDNATNFFTSQSLNNRAGDLASLLDSMGGAINTVNAADQALTAITKLVDAAAATAQQALSEGVTADKSTTSTTGLTDGTNVQTTKAGAEATTLANNGIAAAGEFQITSSITDGAGNETVTTFTSALAASATVEELVDEINASGVASAQVTDDGKLKISSDASAEVKVISKATTDFGGGIADTAANGGKVLATDEQNVNVNRAVELKAQFTELRAQIDKLVEDAGFNGTNLLDGDDLKVVFNEEVGARQSSLQIEGVTFDADGLGIKDGVDFTKKDTLESAIGDLSRAVDTIRSQQQSFGSNLSIVQIRKDFTQEMVNTLQKGADELVLADTNEEGANLLALQTRQQLSSTALGLANQADQAVLRLF